MIKSSVPGVFVRLARIVVLPLLLGLALPLSAGEAAARPEAGMDLSWWAVFEYGGWLMYVLAAMSVFGLALILYLMLVLRPGQVAPRPLVRDLLDDLRAGSIGNAGKRCEDHPCPLASVALTAIDAAREMPERDPAMLREVVESEGSRQAGYLQGQTQLLLDVAVIAPMVGLLGTVFGMFDAFGAVGYSIESARPVALAQGVSKALVTTAFGLLVGIPAMMAHAYFRRRAERQIALLEVASAAVMTALTGRSEQ